MFKKKETYSIKEFMNRKETPVKTFEFKEEVRESLSIFACISALPLAIQPLFKQVTASASNVESIPAAIMTSNAMYDKMLHAFDPLISLVQALAYPVAMVVVLGGAIMVMINQKEKGFGLMQTAGLGYVLVQMTPLVLNILVDAMKVV